MSQIVTHGDTVCLAGQVGEPQHDVAGQTRDALARVDALLAQAGSSREQLLQTTIWLADMEDFSAMNAVWDAWVPEGHAPARACGEAKLSDPAFGGDYRPRGEAVTFTYSDPAKPVSGRSYTKLFELP